MGKPTVFVSRMIPQEGIDLLKKECDVTVSPHDRVLSKQELIDGLRGKDALLCLLTDKIDAEVLDSNPKLRIVSNYAVGFDNVDVPGCTARGLPVTNTPGVLTESVADHALALMLAVARRVAEGDKIAKAGQYPGWSPMYMLGNDVCDRTLGILGLGRIGKSVAERAFKGFRMKILYYDVIRDPQFEKDVHAKFSTVEEVLKNSDFVSIHVPLLPTTKHMISDAQFKMMKPTAYLINTARGPIVDEAALVRALQSKTIAGAALDVFEFEPKLSAGMEKLDNLVVTPHLASATKATRAAMATLAAQNVLDVLNGKVPATQINVKDIHVDAGFKFPFYLRSGKAIKSYRELAVLLETSEDDYKYHVNGHRNDFATWIHDVFKDAKTAHKLKMSRSRIEAAAVLK
ncbi:MAG: D-glycerate dehydrogenase [Nanoarchaeota archaeon]